MASAGTSEQLSSESGKRPKVVVLTGLGVLVGVLALAAGLLVPLLPFVDDGEPAAHREVLQRAEDFAVTYNTYDVAEKDQYQERMADLLTEEYFGEFKRITDAVFSALDSKEQSSGDARVLASAIETVDGDNAVALVAVNASISTSEDDAAVQRRFRWKVTFAKEDGEWLVSQFEQVVPVDAELGEPGEEGGLVPDVEGEDPRGENQSEEGE